jgi:hypothetical protein
MIENPKLKLTGHTNAAIRKVIQFKTKATNGIIPIDISDYTFKGSLKYKNGTLKDFDITKIDSANGKILVEVPLSVTKDLDPGSYPYDIICKINLAEDPIFMWSSVITIAKGITVWPTT